MLSLISMNWDPILLTFKLALITTLILLFIGIPLGYWLAYAKTRFKGVTAALLSMPLVLPPTVLGFYFLLAFSPNNVFGLWLDEFLGLRLVFSFTGLVIASVIYSLPFMVHPIAAGFSNLPGSFKEASQLMGKSRLQTIRYVLLPNIRPALISGVVLTFAHTIGEFGVVLMIGGSIPGQTRVASIAIYDEVEKLNYADAHIYSIILFGLSFIILLWVYSLGRSRINSLLR